MLKGFFAGALALFVCNFLIGQTDTDSAEFSKSLMNYVDSVKGALRYQTGNVKLAGGIAELNVPEKFKFLDAEQSKFIVEDLWGNLPQAGILGTLFPADADPFTENSFAFIISYDAMGYVKDDDVESIDYDEILKEMQEDGIEANARRKEAGISTMDVVGWAAKPYYDASNKTLHWAKNLRVEGEEENTLNYTLMLLGRNGILNLNAVSSMNELADVKAVIPELLQMPKFTEGNAYKDFNPEVDQVAAWTIGGLVAGKMLAKAGVLVFLLKFWKLIAIGVVGIGAFLRKFFTRNKSQEDAWPVDETAQQIQAEEETKA